MSEQANVETVQQIYADFMQGRIPALLSRVNPDVEWTNAGPTLVPYAGRRQGLAEVRQFFDVIAAAVDVQTFEVREYIAGGERVIALGAWSGRARATGKAFASDWAMAWTVRAGQVLSFRSFEDTHAIVAAFSA